jgi:hypothetical protein
VNTVTAASAVGVAAGSGYAVNDLLFVQGGTFTAAAILQVATVNGSGGILTFNLISGGTYSANPTNPAGVTYVASGAGTGATFTLSFAVVTVTPTRAGSYTVLPTNPVTATGGGSGATFNVIIDAVASAAILTAGSYSSPPTSPVFTNDLAGFGATFTMSYDSNGVSVAFNPQFNPTSTDNLVLNGTNNGIDVTFDREMQPGSFTPGNIDHMVGPVGPITTYTLGPVVTFTGGGGSGATGVATIAGGIITGVAATNPGIGYTSAPNAVFTGGGGANAAGTGEFGIAGAQAITAAGIGYAVNDILTVQGGTYSAAAQLKVTAVNGTGGITGVAILQAGGYSVNPVSPVSVTDATTPAASGARFTLAFGTGITGVLLTNGGRNYSMTPAEAIPDGAGITAAAIAAAGSGYAVNDILTVVGGTFYAPAPAKLMVTTVNGTGGITGVTIFQAGSYSANPTNPASVTDATTPAASGATFTLTFGTGILSVPLLITDSLQVNNLTVGLNI